ncbi:MAG: family 1 glycosylhydrolase [Myxococcota bacterium]
MRGALIAAFAAFACSAPPKKEARFPDDFLFGSALSGFQVEMGCPTLPPSECEDRGSDWYELITTTELPDTASLLSGDAPSSGPGHWELFAEDHARAAEELHHNALRMSLEWSRLFPSPTDGVEGHEALKAIADLKALAHYRAMLQSLKDRGLAPLVTLNHYTLPAWLHDTVGCHQDLAACTDRGWLDRPRAVREIAKYAGFAARELGDLVDRWATLNEPFAVVLPGYLLPSAERVNPPVVRLRFDEAKVVLGSMIEGHARMYDAVQDNDRVDADGDGKPSEVGLVYAMTPTRPKDPESKLDQRAAKNVFYLWNTVFLNAVIKGDLDEQLDGTTVHREDLAGRMDYLGINYYTRITVEGLGDPAFPTLSPLTTFNPLTLALWEDYPRGIYEMVLHAHGYGLPSIITENGTPDPHDDGTAPSYLTRHLLWLQRALADGADVRGYFYWSLIDNYEWNHGVGMRFGLYAVDATDPMKKRTPRQAVETYARIVQARDVPADLEDLYPALE